MLLVRSPTPPRDGCVVGDHRRIKRGEPEPDWVPFAPRGDSSRSAFAGRLQSVPVRGTTA